MNYKYPYIADKKMYAAVMFVVASGVVVAVFSLSIKILP